MIFARVVTKSFRVWGAIVNEWHAKRELLIFATILVRLRIVGRTALILLAIPNRLGVRRDF